MHNVWNLEKQCYSEFEQKPVNRQMCLSGRLFDHKLYTSILFFLNIHWHPKQKDFFQML